MRTSHVTLEDYLRFHSVHFCAASGRPTEPAGSPEQPAAKRHDDADDLSETRPVKNSGRNQPAPETNGLYRKVSAGRSGGCLVVRDDGNWPGGDAALSRREAARRESGH